MQIPRRSILKSMMAGSVLAAYGLPRFSFASDTKGIATLVPPRDIVLLTAGATGLFGLGVQNAGAIERISYGTELPDVRHLRRLFSEVRDKRLVGLMSDAAYVLFSELARDAGYAQIFEGHHMIAMDGSSGNHALHSVAGFHGVAQKLTAALAPANTPFAISEVPLGVSSSALDSIDWSPLGFTSYRVGGGLPQDKVWLHLSGLDIGQGCAALGIEPGQAEPLRCWRSIPPHSAAAAGWQQTLGQSLAVMAAGGIGNSAPCVRQAFIHQLLPQQEASAHDSFVSFVMEA
jgi:hypothetical protein